MAGIHPNIALLEHVNPADLDAALMGNLLKRGTFPRFMLRPQEIQMYRLFLSACFALLACTPSFAGDKGVE